MKLLVYPASMDIGGSQINAVDLGGAMARRGHEVHVFGPPGPLFGRVAEHGLIAHEAPPPGRLRPSGPITDALSRTVQRWGIDLVHAYEWPPILEGVCGPQWRGGTPVVGTVLSMGVAPFIPRHVPLVVGTRLMARTERTRRPDVTTVEPPVDTDTDVPDRQLGMQGRGALGVGDDDFLVVAVSRLAPTLKREGLRSAIAAVHAVGHDLPVTLVIVGDGPCRAELTELAERANRDLGRAAVRLVGEWKDPRPAYAAADVALGMGSSALRAMAFAKPLIVQGELGYFRLLDQSTLPEFLDTGWYGLGDGEVHGVPTFAGILRRLYHERGLLPALGEFSRRTVVERFSLTHAADRCEQLYRTTLAAPTRRPGARLAGSLGLALGHQARMIVAIKRGRGDGEDFNSLTAQTLTRMRKALV